MTIAIAATPPAHLLPEIIQGGMGAGVSDWRLARAVSVRGQLGVISGTALDALMVRRLQRGDPGEHIRRAAATFPWPRLAERILSNYYVPGGKAADAPYRLGPIPALPLTPESIAVMVLANYVEVSLAKEGQHGPVGMNYITKIQLPTLPSLLGAILAGVDVVIMGGGIPLQVPAMLDALAQWEPAEMTVALDDDTTGNHTTCLLDPRTLAAAPPHRLRRPAFLAIVSAATLAKTLVRRASGYVDGFVVENHTAGGHNAPPRKNGNGSSTGEPAYGPADDPDVGRIADLGRPFWLAGGYASPEALRTARAQGAHGVQVGSAFALCEESAIAPEIKREVIGRHLCGTLEVVTDHRASPTGYPFKVVQLPGGEERARLCDLGYLRQPYRTPEGHIGYRCPAEPAEAYLRKGGKADALPGRCCLCNGLVATVGMAQLRSNGPERPIVTSGDDLSFLRHLVTPSRTSYTAADVIDYMLGGSGA